MKTLALPLAIACCAALAQAKTDYELNAGQVHFHVPGDWTAIMEKADGDPQAVIFQVPEHRLTGRPEDQAQPLIALINPIIEPLGPEQEIGWEGCLSVPGLKGAVPRYSRIRYRGFAPDGGAIDRSVEGFHARVVQHECDHLDGVLYPQRMTDMRLLMFVEEGARFPIDLTPVPA